MRFFYFQFPLFKTSWAKVWAHSSFRIQLIVTLLVLSALAFFIRDFFMFIQYRPGYRINDLLLSRIPPRDLSVYTFCVIYFTILFSIINFISHPVLFLKGLQAYCLLVIMRVFSLYLFPLEPAPSMIPLLDPFTGYFFYNHTLITKDLFFSGHVSIMVLLSLVNPVSQLKYHYIALTFLTAVFILIQHVHYTIDILAAPLFSWVSYKLAGLIPLGVKG